jgi:hypothetical protein
MLRFHLLVTTSTTNKQHPADAKAEKQPSPKVLVVVKKYSHPTTIEKQTACSLPEHFRALKTFIVNIQPSGDHNGKKGLPQRTRKPHKN